MRFIAENTTVPVPKVYSVRKYGRVTAIEMEFVRGREATHAWNTMSVEAQRALLEELISYVKQLRSLTPPTPELVASTTSGHCVDHRFGVRPGGPFTRHEEFHCFLREGDELWQWDNYPEVAESHTKTYISKFTHGDLLPRNVMVHEGRISAIIDWDSAGWRPEYWEVTKAHFAALGAPKEWIQALESATGSTYEVQLKAELKLWTAAEFPTRLGGRLAGIDKTRENQTRDAA
ncbi:kinase-like domain-containing protein [Mycena rebaudengoi]|nr:kinase-like domain-containing protein [Mycena rebaudengoi]